MFSLLLNCLNTQIQICLSFLVAVVAQNELLRCFFPKLIKAMHFYLLVFLFFHCALLMQHLCFCCFPPGELAECTRLVHSPVFSQGLMIHVSRLTLPSFPVLDNQSIVCLLLSLALFCTFSLFCLHFHFFTSFLSLIFFFFLASMIFWISKTQQ